MNKSLEVTELALVIAAPNYDPTLLNPSFLTYSGIIPSDWELARQPVVSQRTSQIIYNNGVNLVAQPNRLTLVEALATKSSESVGIAEIARRYTEALPNLDYQAVSINFRGYVPFAASEEGAHQYLFKTLLVPGPWTECGTAPVQAGLNFVYTFEHNRLNLSINEAALQLPESEQIPIVLFSGNFDYDLGATPSAERRSRLQEIVKNWQSDQETYTSVANKFLKTQTETELILPVSA